MTNAPQLPISPLSLPLRTQLPDLRHLLHHFVCMGWTRSSGRSFTPSAPSCWPLPASTVPLADCCMVLLELASVPWCVQWWISCSYHSFLSALRVSLPRFRVIWKLASLAWRGTSPATATLWC